MQISILEDQKDVGFYKVGELDSMDQVLELQMWESEWLSGLECGENIEIKDIKIFEDIADEDELEEIKKELDTDDLMIANNSFLFYFLSSFVFINLNK